MFYRLRRFPLAACLAVALFPLPSPACADSPAPAPEHRMPIALEQHVGREVTLRGEVAPIPYAHMIQMPPGAGARPEINYIDLYQGGQIVVYFPELIACPGPVDVIGTVQAIKGPGKGSQAGKTFTEYQLAATGWVCLGQRIAEMIAELGSDQVPFSAKQALRQQLAGEGMLAVPVLIAHLDDARIYERKRDVQNYHALPPHQPPPPPIYADISVGEVCRELLYQIITPVYQSPFTKTQKPYSQSLFQIKDWRHWWQKHKGMSLAQVHEQMKPVVDQYWKANGTEQVIE